MLIKLFTCFLIFGLTLACDDPNEIEKKCGSPYKPTCLNQQKLIKISEDGRIKGCVCKRGYIKTSNENGGFCVLIKQCPAVRACSLQNAVYSRCGGLCGPNCNNPVPFPCPCKQGCSCKDGYIKTTIGGPCVPKGQCPAGL